MNTFNNFSPLAFREKSQKATYKKWYAYGKEFALPFSTTELPPFQFTVVNLPVFDPSTVEVFLVNEATGVRGATGINPKFDTMDEHNAVLYVSPGSNVYAKSIEPGVYRAEFTIPGGETYVSTPICVTEGIETNTNFVKLEYWNDEKLAYPNGFVTTGTDNDFKFQMYIPTTFFKPKYEFEEEITKRAGYKFLELQTCNKVFGFNFLAPEYICDALRLVRLSDYIRFTHDGEYYNALNFEYNPDWQDNGYLAAIECQFETDTIIQKLPSFNRRDRESFYNALLADIDTPILFSPDTVGLYYREFKQGEPTIKGKLIRELSPIDLIDENTTIAVDMGAGEARKFNLYRMLEGYISKNHEDVTEFLLSLRGGVNIGTPNASSEYPASVDREGNAKLKNIQGNDATLNNVTGKDATFKTVETLALTVNQTAATIDPTGEANLRQLITRENANLQGDVNTGLGQYGQPTGKITKEGQLQYLSAIIYEFLSSETFVPGFLGEGFKIWVENGNWHIECDNLTVRQTMNIFELLIQKIRSVNGAIVVSQSNGKVTAVEDTGAQYKITFGDEFPTFQAGDLMRCQTWSGIADTFPLDLSAHINLQGRNVAEVGSDHNLIFNGTSENNGEYGVYSSDPNNLAGMPVITYPDMLLKVTKEGDGNTTVTFQYLNENGIVNTYPVDQSGVVRIPAIKTADNIKAWGLEVRNVSSSPISVRITGKQEGGSKFYWVEADRTEGSSVFVNKIEFTADTPAVGDEVVQMGNTRNTERQALIYITAQESGKPYIEILNGVKTKSLTGTDRTRLGDLSNIVDPDFTGEAAVKGTGFYSTNAFLKGIFVLRNGKRVEDEIKIAKDAADQAAQDAANAAQTAQEAKDRLNKWADDGFISPTEKPALIDEGKRIQAEYLQIKANADKYGVSITQYTEAYNNYLNELRYHSAATPEDIAVRPELAQSQTIYYDRRNGALNAIADAAKSYVDEADKKLKDYLDTEITAIPGKIELAVRSLKVADVNLLKGGYKELKNADYGFGAYSYDVPLVNGKEYTLTVCYTLSANNTHIQVYSDGGLNRLVDFDTKGNMVVESKKVTMVGYKLDTKLTFFQFPQGTYGSKVHWAVLTDGNLGVTSWIPSASEKNVGLKNLCSFKHITDAKFTYASRYDDDGTFLIDVPVLHKETLVANKDMFGLTYNGNKRYYIFVDYSEPTATIPSGVRSIFFRVIYTDGTTYEISVFNDRIENNFLLTEKPISRIVGSYGTGVNGYMRIGVYETNFPVSWTPAPEDQLYQSVKYTDTQILAVDGKISLSVTTELNKRVIGGANLCLKSGVCITGVENHLRINMSKYWRDLRGKKVTISFDYEYSNLVLGRNSRVGLEEAVLKDGTSNHYYIGTWKYFDSTSLKADTGRFVHTIPVPNDIANAQNIGIGFYIQVGDGTTMKICNPQIEIGDTATGWSPAPEDGVNQSIEYTNQQISIVEGKISLEVSKEIQNTQFGGNNLYSYTSSPLNQLYPMDAVDRKTDIHGFYLVGKQDGGGAVRIPNIIPAIPGKYTVSGWIKGTQMTPVGFYIDICDSSRVRVNSNASNTWSYFKHTFDVTKNTEAAHSTYNFVNLEEVSWAYVWVKDFKVEFGEIATAWSPNEQDPVYKSAEYTNSKIDVTNQSITAAVQRISATENRLTSAELKLTDTSAKLSVVEGTANDAKTTAGTASNKADAVDGRVTATQNGLVETGINITSRKIVLKSDNVLFQNNAGQQTAALNANGRLTANVIEAGEVVANGFAAQRITTGNLTVTDGAVIAGMSISGNRLTGGNITLTNGARIGSFQVSLNWLTGLNSSQIDLWAGANTGEGNNTLMQPGHILINQKGDNQPALEIQGKGNTLIAGKYCSLNVDTFQVTANQVRIPGVFFACSLLSNATIGKTWGSFNFHITGFRKLSTGRYTVTYTGYTGDLYIMLQPMEFTKWGCACIEPYSRGSFTYKTFDANSGLFDCAVIAYFCGMPS